MNKTRKRSSKHERNYFLPLGRGKKIVSFLKPEKLSLFAILYSLFPTAYCLLPNAYCLLLAAYCLFPIPYCLLPIKLLSSSFQKTKCQSII